MATIIKVGGPAPVNPNAGVGDGIAALGQALYGGNEAQQALIREKYTEAQRLNAGKLQFQDALRNYGNTSPEELAARGNAAGETGAGLGGYGRFITASRFGAEDPRTGAQQIAAGQGFGDTFAGVKLKDDTTRLDNANKIAEQRYEFENTNVNTLNDQGQSTVTRRKDAYGRAAPEALNVVQGNAARNALTAGGGTIPETLNDKTSIFIGADKDNEKSPEVIRLQRQRDALPVGDPRRAELDKIIQSKGISAGGEGTYDKHVQEGYAKTDLSIQNDAAGSGQRVAMLDNVAGMLRSGKVMSGPLSEPVLAAKQFAKMIGMDVDGVPETELFRAMGNKLMLDLAPNGSLGGQISNSDARVMAQSVPGMANSPQGNLMLIDTMKAVEARKRQTAEWLREYKASHGGRVDGGWQQFLAQKAEANPIFPQAQNAPAVAAPNTPAAAPQPTQRVRIDVNGNALP